MGCLGEGYSHQRHAPVPTGRQCLTLKCLMASCCDKALKAEEEWAGVGRGGRREMDLGKSSVKGWRKTEGCLQAGEAHVNLLMDFLVKRSVVNIFQALWNPC